MEIAFYFYTILVMLVCIAAGTISLSAYFVCRKRSHLYMVAFFLFYFLDLALISRTNTSDRTPCSPSKCSTPSTSRP